MSRQVVGWRLATAVYAALLFVVSVTPVDPRLTVGHLDKVAHLGEYLLFAWLLVHALRTTAPPAGWEPVYPWCRSNYFDQMLRDVEPTAVLNWRSVAGRRIQLERHWWAWMFATSYGLLIECLQALLPWRSAELADALANACGAALGVWLAR